MWPPYAVGAPLSPEKIRPFGTKTIVIVIVHWAMRVEQLQPWHVTLEAALTSAIMAASALVVMEVAAFARRAWGRFIQWFVKRVKVKARAEWSVTLGQD